MIPLKRIKDLLIASSSTSMRYSNNFMVFVTYFTSELSILKFPVLAQYKTACQL